MRAAAALIRAKWVCIRLVEGSFSDTQTAVRGEAPRLPMGPRRPVHHRAGFEKVVGTAYGARIAQICISTVRTAALRRVGRGGGRAVARRLRHRLAVGQV